MINIVPIDDWIDHKHDATCVCEPDVLRDSAGVELLMHYSCGPKNSKYVCNMYSDGRVVQQIKVARKDK